MLKQSLAILAVGMMCGVSGVLVADGPYLGQPANPPVYIVPPNYEETLPPPGIELGEEIPLPEHLQRQEVIPYEVYSQPQAIPSHYPPKPELYKKVVYKDEHRKHPGAVPYLVEVPLYKPILPRRRAKYCGPECASILICVPPCGEPCVRVTRRGHKLRYDFGKYEVDVVVRRTGTVIVDYDS